MRHVNTIAIAALAFAATAGTSATARDRSRTARTVTTMTLHLRSHLEHAQIVDSAPSGRSPGDLLVFTERLLNSRGQQVGSDAATCVALFDQRSLCTGAYVLAQGQLMIQVLQPNLTGTRTFTEVVTGGTGKYAGATGTVTDNQGASGDKLTFHIHLPRGNGR